MGELVGTSEEHLHCVAVVVAIKLEYMILVRTFFATDITHFEARRLNQWHKYLHLHVRAQLTYGNEES